MSGKVGAHRSASDRACALRAEPQDASQAKPLVPCAVERAINCLIRGIPIQPVVTFKGKHLFDRYEFLRTDEHPDKWFDRLKAREPNAKRPHALPWWMPFNAFIHNWNPEPGAAEEFHDHPRWSITVCLRGKIIEQSPWGERLLVPGSVVLRGRKAIHRFRLPSDAGEVWTLFIVGRRKARQNTYRVEAQ